MNFGQLGLGRKRNLITTVSQVNNRARTRVVVRLGVALVLQALCKLHSRLSEKRASVGNKYHSISVLAEFLVVRHHGCEVSA